MADNEFPKPEDLAESQRVAAEIQRIFDTVSSSTERIQQSLQIQLSSGGQLNDALKERFGTQLEYMTNLEKEAELLQGAMDSNEELLKLQKEYAELQNLSTDNAAEMTDAEKRRLKELERINSKQNDILKTTQDEINKLEEVIDKQRELVKESQKRAKAVAGVGDMFENQLQQTFGLSSNAKNLTQSIFQAGMEGASLSEVFDKMKKKTKEAMNPLTLGLTAMGHLADRTEKLKESFGALGARTQMSELNKQFVQATGLTSEFGGEIKNLQRELVLTNGILIKESSAAVSALNDNFVDFTEIGSGARKELVDLTARLGRLGVDSSTTATLVSNLTKSLGNSTSSSAKLTKSLTNFSRAIGVGPNKMLGNLNKNFDLLAKFGEKKGVEVFKKLAMTAKATGIEFEKLIGITKAFDTFEGAAESAGKLNFLLGGPLLNSTELLMASEEERVQMVQDALASTGKSFEELGRFEKEAIAATLQVDVTELGKLMDPTSAAAFKDMAAGADAQAAAMKGLKEETDEVLTRQQIQQQNEEKRIAALGELSDKLVDLATDFDRFMGRFAELGGILDFLAPILTTVIMLLGFSAGGLGGAATAVGAAFTKLGAGISFVATKMMVLTEVVIGGLLKAMGFLIVKFLVLVKTMIIGLGRLTIAFLTNPIGLAIMAIVGVFALLYTYWDEVVEGISSALEFLGDIFSSISEGIANAFSGAMESISSAFTAVVDFLAGPLETLKEMFSSVASFIASVFIEALFAFPTAVAMGFDFVADKIAKGINFLIEKIPETIRDTIGISLVPEGGLGLTDTVGGFKESVYESIGLEPAFADGTESAPGGMSLVGEEGPELVNLPGRTQVVPADETKSMMSTLDTFNKIASNAAASTAMSINQPTAGPSGVANLNETINVVLDGDVLARHTRKVTVDTMEQALRPQGAI